MVAFYVKRIKSGLMKLSAVPAKWRDAVEAELQLEFGFYRELACATLLFKMNKCL